MSVADMERRFFELKGRLDLGTITEAEFKAEIEKLRFEDAQGRWWMIGAQSGKWYVFDGIRWLPGQTPADSVPPKAVSTQAEPLGESVTAPSPTTPAPSAQEPSAEQVLAQAIEPQPTVVTPQIDLSVSEPIHDEFTVEPPRDEMSVSLTVPQTEQKPVREEQVFVAPFTPSAPIPPTPLFPSETPPREPQPPRESVPVPAIAVEPTHVNQIPAPPSVEEHVTPAPVRRTSRLGDRKSTVPGSAFKSRALPVSAPVFIGLAAVLAILAVIVFWFAFDNLVPGKPISRMFGLTTGGTPRPLTPGAQTVVPRDVAPLLTMGDQLITQSNIDAAITQYQNAAQLAPNNAAPLTRLSRVYAYKGDVLKAIAQAQQAIQMAPNDADANAQFCRMLAWNGQVAEAIVACDSAMRADPKNGTARTALVEAYLFAKRLPDAQTQLPNALQLASQSAETYRVQAWMLTLQGQRAAALDAWRQTLQLEPDFYFRHFEFAEVLRVVYNAPVDAIPEYKKSISLYGGYVPAIGRLGIALIVANQPQEAIPQLRRAITLEPNNADNYAYLAVAYGKTNQCAQAIPYFEQALKIDPGNSIAQKGLADCKAGKEPVVPPPVPPTVPLVPPAMPK